jgi:hypothetical protein
MSCFEVCEKRFQIPERFLNWKVCAREILFPKGSFFALDRFIYQSPGDSDTGVFNDRDSKTVAVRGKDSYMGEVIRIKKILKQEFCFYWICSYTGEVLLPYRGSYFIREILKHRDFIFKKYSFFCFTHDLVRFTISCTNDNPVKNDI